ncbi:anthranilate phosphoribosyltransferase [Azospirillum griseum]|uniref:Glycosyl transferase family 3 domain-containing protein n=1 Tax=Azospirillum griseum TaxID=2496639 RepID=A0A3S0KBT1_9PROT|nr:hypothetical protein [Azospirillum griseum]RTR21098.1 hypothetical protein EJ903_10215 [Azospirillum griseum]
MSDLVGTLLLRDRPVSVTAWRDLWDRLHARTVSAAEAAAVLASLSTHLPDVGTLAALLASLSERRCAAAPAPASVRAVNIVGTGGGPSTFNISTAAAFVAAALGVTVIKTGSRAYTSRCGSIDLLNRLGIPLTTSPAMTAEMLDRFGIAFAGSYVYPPELTLLAKAVMPLDMKRLGRCFNRLGPFLADVPVAVQVTGLSDPALLPLFRALAGDAPQRRFWFCTNGLGVDELVAIAPNTVLRDGAETGRAGQDPVELDPAALGLAGGTLEDLRPPQDDAGIVPHTLAVLAGDAPTAAVDTVCLNAAVLALAAGVANGWEEGIRLARAAVARGDALRLVENIRAQARGAAAAPWSRRTVHG